MVHSDDQTYIHKFLNKIKKKESIKLHNHGLNFRDFTFVGDG